MHTARDKGPESAAGPLPTKRIATSVEQESARAETELSPPPTPKQHFKRVKRNGKIVFVPCDQKPEKPLVSQAVLSYAVPVLVATATVVGSIAGGAYYLT